MTEKWNVTYTWHTHEEKWHIATAVIEAENIGFALNEIGEMLNNMMDKNNWSDYWVMGINHIAELH